MVRLKRAERRERNGREWGFPKDFKRLRAAYGVGTLRRCSIG